MTAASLNQIPVQAPINPPPPVQPGRPNDHVMDEEVSDDVAARENADVPNEVDATSQAYYDRELSKYAGGKAPEKKGK